VLDIEITLAAEAGRQRYEERMQMATQRMKYEADDGVLFDTAAEADAHDFEREMRVLANQFASLDGEDDGGAPTKRTITQRVNLIVAWELWRREA